MSAAQQQSATTTLVDYPTRKFAFAAVEGISRAALDLHLDLYAGYVKQLNVLQTQLIGLHLQAKLNDAERLRKDGLVRRLAFEHNGVALHELFFEQLDGEQRAARPASRSDFMTAIDATHGGFDGWLRDIGQLAETRGVGWVVSGWHPGSRRLLNFWIDEHHLGVPVGMVPLVVFDLWEHAYLLDFAPADRKRYLQVLLSNTDWQVIEARCQVST